MFWWQIVSNVVCEFHGDRSFLEHARRWPRGQNRVRGEPSDHGRTRHCAHHTLTGVTELNDQIDDITTEVERDQRRGEDADCFVPNGVAQGWRGYFALTASSTSGNTDNGELAGAGRLS